MCVDVKNRIVTCEQFMFWCEKGYKLILALGSPKTQCSYHFLSTPKEFFRNSYFEVYDQTVNGIKERFNEPDYRIYINLQELILKTFNEEDFSKELDAVTDFYDSDFERFNLESQLQLLHQRTKPQKIYNTRCYYANAKITKGV